MSSRVEPVFGRACLDFIDKDIGLIATDRGGRTNDNVYTQQENFSNPTIKPKQYDYQLYLDIENGCYIDKVPHDRSKRKIGVVLENYADGGKYVAIMGQGEIINADNVKYFDSYLKIGFKWNYEPGIQTKVVRTDSFNYYPATGAEAYYIDNTTYGNMYIGQSLSPDSVPFDELLDFSTEFHWGTEYMLNLENRYLLELYDDGGTREFKLTNDINNTVRFGRGDNRTIKLYEDFCADPLEFVGGNIYTAMYDYCNRFARICPAEFDDFNEYGAYSFEFGNALPSFNQYALPYNLLLTNNPTWAQSYLNTGALPPDAFLYPLDWENLPQYIPEVNPDDEPDDNTNDNIPGDNGRDITPNPPIKPAITPSMLSNYNFYWLDISQYADFIRWFWDDIGDINDFDDIINKVKGLYNDVASAVLMCRYYPVELSWIGGAGNPSRIVVGMLEKDGQQVTTISNTTVPDPRLIGDIHISKKFKSFLDMAPYTQLSLYLPFHAFIDLDIDIFMGHTLYVYAVYDYLTGTIQYLIYCGNPENDGFLVNTVVAKMSVDIPITLQTKNDRDSAIFSNVSNTVAGLIGAGSGIISGNPIGMALGATQGVSAINGNNTSAPLNVKGTVGETGAFYAPPQCAIILRRPTIQPSDKTKGNLNLSTWEKNVGQLCGYGYTLSSLKNTGFTTCYTPRITFTKSTPLQAEVDEIYKYLEEGVIL